MTPPLLYDGVSPQFSGGRCEFARGRSHRCEGRVTLVWQRLFPPAEDRPPPVHSSLSFSFPLSSPSSSSSLPGHPNRHIKFPGVRLQRKQLSSCHKPGVPPRSHRIASHSAGRAHEQLRPAATRRRKSRIPVPPHPPAWENNALPRFLTGRPSQLDPASPRPSLAPSFMPQKLPITVAPHRSEHTMGQNERVA